MYRLSTQVIPLALRPFSSLGVEKLCNPTDMHRQLRETVSRFAKEELEPHSRSMDIKGEFRPDLFARLGELGLFGITIPTTHGGSGSDATAVAIVHHELSRVDPGFCLAYLAHELLFVNNFYQSATEQQRERILPRVLNGKEQAAMAMSEPSVGTDVLAMKTRAEQKPNGHFVLNGSKTWITNGPTASLFLVYAKVDNKITLFVVEEGMPGFRKGPSIDKCGMRSSRMCQLFFENVDIPPENVVGEQVGKGLKAMMRNLEIERLGLAAMGIGIAERCVEVMLQYAKERQSFGVPLVKHGQIQAMIANAFAESEAGKALVYATSQNMNPNTQNRLGTDACKLFVAPMAKRVADYAMQVLGGMGYSRDFCVERLWRDAKLLEIGGGTNEAHQKNLVKELTNL